MIRKGTHKALVIGGHGEARDPSWCALIAAIFAQAVRDAKGENATQALDAALWLASPDAETYLDALGFESDPLKLLITGRVRGLKRV